MPDKIALAMITTDRSVKGRTNYIFQTLQNLKIAGVFDSRHYHSLTIHIDGCSETYSESVRGAVSDFPNVIVTWHEHSAGSAGNAARANSALAMSDADWGMILEDDLRFANEFLERLWVWLQNSIDSNRIVYQIGVWKEYVKQYGDTSGVDRPWFDFYGHNEQGLRVEYTLKKPTTLMRGSQCYVMRPEHSRLFADYIHDLMNVEGVSKLIHHDMRLRHWLNKLAKQRGNNHLALLRSPKPTTFVQHIGIESSVYRVKNFIDPEFNFIDK